MLENLKDLNVLVLNDGNGMLRISRNFNMGGRSGIIDEGF